MRETLCSLVCLAVVLAGCSKSKTPTASEPMPAATPASAPRELAPCELLTSAEIESVQGEPMIESKPSKRAEGAFTVSQCYFALKTSSNSVVLTVTQRGGGASAREPREFWEQTFHKKEDAEEKKGEREGEEEEHRAPPMKVDGVGEEAFWTGNAIGGALYVLSGNAFLRVAVGGASDQTTKIERSKKLAEMALHHL